MGSQAVRKCVHSSSGSHQSLEARHSILQRVRRQITTTGLSKNRQIGLNFQNRTRGLRKHRRHLLLQRQPLLDPARHHAHLVRLRLHLLAVGRAAVPDRAGLLDQDRQRARRGQPQQPEREHRRQERRLSLTLL